MAYEGDVALQDGAQVETGVFTLSAGRFSFCASVEVIRRAAESDASFISGFEDAICLDGMILAEKTTLIARIRDRALQFAMDALAANADARAFVSMIASPQEAAQGLSEADISGILEQNFATNRP